MHDWQHTGYQQKQFQLKKNNISENSTTAQPSPQNQNKVRDCFFECGRVETPFHYMQCTSDILTTARVKGKEQLDRDLHAMQTAPSLQDAILQGIFCWEDGTKYDFDQESNKYLFNEAHT
jgi:hypothetical protein